MKKINLIKLLLFISGIIAILIGTSLLFFPIEFEASAGVTIDANASSLSEVRSSGGLIFASGIIILIGIFKRSLIIISLVISSLLYLAYGFSRIISLVLDGIPHESILIAAIVEIIVGVISILALKRINSNKIIIEN